MSLTLNNKRLWGVLISSFAILGGVTLKDSIQEYSENPNPNKLLTMLGVSLFIIGWIGVAYFVSLGKEGRTVGGIKTWLGLISSLFIMLSALSVRWAEDTFRNTSPPRWVMASGTVFAMMWLLLGYSVSIGKSSGALWFGLSAAILAIFSALVVVPWQRSRNIVDGPGIILLTLAWVSFAVANAM